MKDKFSQQPIIDSAKHLHHKIISYRYLYNLKAFQSDQIMLILNNMNCKFLGPDEPKSYGKVVQVSYNAWIKLTTENTIHVYQLEKLWHKRRYLLEQIQKNELEANPIMIA